MGEEEEKRSIVSVENEKKIKNPSGLCFSLFIFRFPFCIHFFLLNFLLFHSLANPCIIFSSFRFTFIPQAMVTEALEKHPDFAKLYMMRGQIAEQQGNVAAAREAYAQGMKACPTSIPLWTLAAALEMKEGEPQTGGDCNT